MLQSSVFLHAAVIVSLVTTIGVAVPAPRFTGRVTSSPATVAWDDSYDATIITFQHGWLTVIDAQCHHHSLWETLTNRRSLSTDALRNWGWKHANANVRIYEHKEGDPPNLMEVPEQIVLRPGASDIEKCDKETHSVGSSAVGRIVEWDEGNAFGSFTLRLSSGATRDFTFAAGKEPLFDGHRVFCENLYHNCAAFLFKGQRVRVYYKIVDSPDGPSIMPLRIKPFK